MHVVLIVCCCMYMLSVLIAMCCMHVVFIVCCCVVCVVCIYSCCCTYVCTGKEERLWPIVRLIIIIIIKRQVCVFKAFCGCFILYFNLLKYLIHYEEIT